MSRNKEKLLPFYWDVVLKHHLGFAAGLLALMLLSATLDMATVGLGVPLLETVTNGDGYSQNVFVQWIQSALLFCGLPIGKNVVLFALVVVVALVVVAHGCDMLVQQYATAYMAKKMYGEVKSKLFRQVLLAPFGYLAEKSRGATLYHVNTPAIAAFEVITTTSRLFSSALNAIFMIGLMLYLSWWVTVTIGILGIVWILAWRQVIDKRSNKVGRELFDLESRVSKMEVDAVDGVKVVKAHGLADNIVSHLSSLLKNQIRPHLKLALLSKGITFINEIVVCGVVMILGAISLLFQWGGLTFSELVVFFLALRRISPSLASINGAYSQLNKERKSVEVVHELLHVIPEEKYGSGNIECVRSVMLKDLSFHYPDKETQSVLKNVSLNLRRGEVTAMVGSTGSGKSTLANLLIGFYQPVSGKILVNGIDLQSLDLSDWRKKIGYVSQDIFLFNDTIFENIVLWDPSKTMADVERVARLAQLHDFIVSLPEAYETAVGDRGLRLSGGQAQRVAIARAMLRHPELLIFDEATSALDNLTEKAVYSAIRSLKEDAIILVIAHRLSTIRDANQICVLKNGNIVEQGSHDDLMQQGSYYAQLYQGSELLAGFTPQ